MSADPVGGYILFEPGQNQDDLLASTLQAMELQPGEFEVRLPDKDGFPRFAGEGYPMRTEDSLEQALAVLAQLESGVIEANGPDHRETLWFEPMVGSYPVINIWVVDNAMFYKEWPEYSEAFVQRWLQLCEQGHAVFGYFSPFSYTYEREYVEQQVLPWIQSANLSKLLLPSDCYWLIYMGPELARQWREQQMPLPEIVNPLLSRELPSGAHFLRITTSVYGY